MGNAKLVKRLKAIRLKDGVPKEEFWEMQDIGSKLFDKGMIKFGENLRTIRIKKKMSQEELAKILNIRTDFLDSLEKYIDDPGISLTAFIEWCEILEVSPNEMLL